MTDLASDLCAFADAGPSPFHAVAEMARRLENAGFTELDERQHWDLQPGGRHYVVRDGGSIAAFKIGSGDPAEVGLRLIGAHTDSPTLKVRPHWDVRRAGYRVVGVEPYGGLLMHTWLDRDLTVAGRVVVAGDDGAPSHRLVHLPGAGLRVPSLAIHLYRELREEGLKLDPQQHLVPVHGPEDDGQQPLMAQVAAAAGCDEDDIVGHDLVTADTQSSSVYGGSIRAPRLDNLWSCHAGILALTEADAGDCTQILVANDHEEVGSGSAEGARGPFLGDVVARLLASTGHDDPQTLPRTMARSLLVSADCAHAVHPNYADRHEQSHRPMLGGGPVIKVNANQAYATDAASAAAFRSACRQAGVETQYFVTRADLPCGSTIGPLTATRLGLATVDIGAPILSMHSCREQGDARDVHPTVEVLRAHLEAQ